MVKLNNNQRAAIDAATQDVLREIETKYDIEFDLKMSPITPWGVDSSLSSRLLEGRDVVVIHYNPFRAMPSLGMAMEALRVDRALEDPGIQPVAMMGTPFGQRVAYQTIWNDLPFPKDFLGEEAESYVNDGHALVVDRLDKAVSEPWLLERLVRDYPDRGDVWKDGIKKFIEETEHYLEPEHARNAPHTVHNALISMNAAYIHSASDILGLDLRGTPYEAPKNIGQAAELLKINYTDRGRQGDVAATDAWADALRIRDWYSWVARPRAAELPAADAGIPHLSNFYRTNARN